MDHNQMLVLALANVPTMITVVVGIVINNSRMADLNSRITNLNVPTNSFESRLTNLENKFDRHCDVIMGKLVDIEHRLMRMESQRH
jgi:hypothetical protein